MSKLPLKASEFKELVQEVLLTPYKTRAPSIECKAYFPHFCYLCGKPMSYYRPKITHFNKEQNPSKKYFCSISCRDEWMDLTQEKTNDPANNDLITNQQIEMIRNG